MGFVRIHTVRRFLSPPHSAAGDESLVKGKFKSFLPAFKLTLSQETSVELEVRPGTEKWKNSNTRREERRGEG